MEEPLVACLVRASSLLFPRFIRGLGRLELLSCGELLLLFMSDWLPSSSLYVRRVDGVGEWFGVLGYVLGSLSHLISARSVRRVRFLSAAPVSFPQWPPNGLGLRGRGVT